MMSQRVFSDVMRIVEFHHQGHLESFVYDQFLRMCRARYVVDLYDFQIDGVIDADGELDVNFVPGVVSDPRIQLRLIDPEFTAGLATVHEAAIRVNGAYDIAHDALRLEDASRLAFCLQAYDVLMIEDGFVLPPVFRRWCDIAQEYVVIPLGVGGVGSRYLRGRQAAYAAWVAKVRV